MAIKLIERTFHRELCGYQDMYILDSAADVAKLPSCCPGSTATVVDKGGAIYMVNASGEWREL